MQSIKIGRYNFEYPVFPAPMCGVMDAPFRAMLLKFGTPLLYTEMIASHATILECRKKYIKSATLKETDKVPFVIQLVGCDPKIMGDAADIVIQQGADIIDMNFGCPVKKVVNSFAGSALMKDVKLSKDIIKSVVKTATKNDIPVTIKMRIGWDENHKNACEIAKIAENEGVKTITIHCRTRSQLYSGQADWTFAEELKKNVKIPVIVNGDINLQNMDEALKASNADGVMIGRALYGKPWLIADCISHLQGNDTLHKPKDIWNDCVREHLERIFDFHPERNVIGVAIRNLYYYSYGLPGGAEFRCAISKCNSKISLSHISYRFFCPQH